MIDLVTQVLDFFITMPPGPVTEPGQMFWWAALYAVPTWLVTIPYLVPPALLGALSFRRWWITGLEVSWVAYLLLLWFAKDSLWLKTQVVIPVCTYVGVLGVALCALGCAVVLVRKRSAAPPPKPEAPPVPSRKRKRSPSHEKP